MEHPNVPVVPGRAGGDRDATPPRPLQGAGPARREPPPTAFPDEGTVSGPRNDAPARSHRPVAILCAARRAADAFARLDRGPADRAAFRRLRRTWGAPWGERGRDRLDARPRRAESAILADEPIP